VYELVRELHHIGISHGDLEPQNIARRRDGGGFYLVDFSESRRHRCKEIESNLHVTFKVDQEHGLGTEKKQISKCAELKALRDCLALGE
jgi:tRNA A-37 threonylcarbamoyl transferase component Bud32